MTVNHHENVIPNVDIGVRFYKSNVDKYGYVPFHWHTSIEIVCVLDGELKFNFNGKSHRVKSQQFMVISSGVIHDVTNTPNTAFVLQIPLKFIENYHKHPELLKFQIQDKNSPNYQKIINYFLELNQINDRHYAGYLFDFGAVLLFLLKVLITDFSTSKTTKQAINTSNLKELIAFINLNYAKPLSVQYLAQKINYNPNYLSRLFKQQIGLTITDYIYKIRINAFYQDLIKTDKPISELMIKHGLNNAKTTRKTFKNIYNKLPSQIRNDFHNK